ncbi:hypothetical protein [Proteiniborus sp. MB09-C3]|uniref:hypothetical protein n=1 Tax=Proteiniborus sp. MB09-C3 TaxID=3050072 RepID=UPI002554A242|nr:hypothetical protein [Proteiniborus sp. MB09-C3]WIV11474.1 hypothetical protein QO263_15435 [Proteiniborus sp. MB09-C3]
MTLQNPLNLTQINQAELQNLSEIISNHKLMTTKLYEYASMCQDTQLKQMFSQGAQDANTTAQNLIQSI